MRFPLRYLAILLVVLFGTLGAVRAAIAQERCSGTLCDLYYGGPPPTEPAPSTAPHPLTVPQTISVPGASMIGRLFGGSAPAPATSGTPPAAPAPRPMVGVQGGGLAGLANGKPADRCSGTLCDFFYGGPSQEEQHAFDDKPVEQTAPASTRTASDQPAPEPVADPGDASPTVAYRSQPAEPQRCAAAGHDPWSCYR